MSVILEAARAAYAAGLAPVPVENTGSKKPAVGRWKHYQTTRPTVEEMRAFNFTAHDGLGIIAGAVSGHRECWDFDTDQVYLDFVNRAHGTGLGALVDRLFIEGYLDRTPGGGRRSIIGFPTTIEFKDITLARRPGRAGEPPIKTLIELPTFAIIAPSNGRTHPSGKPYERLSGDFTTIASYTLEERASLFALARTFDEMPRVEARMPSLVHTDVGTRPGDDFNRRTTWSELLEPRGWTMAFDRDGLTYWRRPGKAFGVSATTNYAGSDLFYPFTSSTVFEPDKSYSKFAVLTWLDFDGDFGRAALALFKQGYGDDRTTDPLDDTDPAPKTATGPTPTSSTSTPRSLRLTPASDITVRPVTWLWTERLPVGVFTLVGGREGIGKSILTYTLAAGVTTGTLPGIYMGRPKGVIVCATEDSWAHTITPRLMAAGADLTRVFRADIIDPDGFELPLSLPKDTAALSQAITDVECAMVIFDPLLSRLDARLDSHKDSDTRRALEPLSALADTAKVTVVGLIHVNKSASTDALTLLMASRAFTAVARSVLFVATDPDDDQHRQLFVAKNNLGRTDLPTLLFTINGVLVATTSDGDDVWTGKLTWRGESDQSLRDVLERVGEREGDKVAMQEAEDWLRDYLESQGGTAAKKTITDMGRRAGHSERTLTRARQHAGILTDGRGFPRQSYWILSSSSSQATSQATSQANTVSHGPTGDAGPTETVGVQLGHDPPVRPWSGDVPTGGPTGVDPTGPVRPRSSTSLLRGPTGELGPTAPEKATFADTDPVGSGGLRLSAFGTPIPPDEPDE